MGQARPVSGCTSMEFYPPHAQQAQQPGYQAAPLTSSQRTMQGVAVMQGQQPMAYNNAPYMQQ